MPDNGTPLDISGLDLYYKYRPFMKPLDMIVYADRSVISAGIQLVTGRQVGHVSPVLRVDHVQHGNIGRDLVLVAEAVASGMDVNRLSRKVARYDRVGGWVYWLRMKQSVRDQLNEADAVGFLMDITEKEVSYDWWQALLCGFSNRVKESFARAFCSEAAVGALEEGGVVPPTNASRWNPGHLVSVDLWDSYTQLTGTHYRPLVHFAQVPVAELAHELEAGRLIT